MEVFEAYHEANQAFIEVRFPEGKNMTSLEVEEAKSIALLNKVGKTALNSLLPGDPDLLSERVCAAVSGKSVGGDDDNCSMFDDSPDVDEEALIEEKTEFEKTFIRKFRSIFS